MYRATISRRMSTDVSLRPKLVTVSRQGVDIDGPAENGPEAPRPRFIAQILGVVHRAGKDALPRAFDDPLAERRTEPVRCPAHERLDACDFRTRQAVELRYFDNPAAAPGDSYLSARLRI